VLYGVPLFWGDAPRSDSERSASVAEIEALQANAAPRERAPRRVNARAQDAASAVRISVADRAYGCSPVPWSPGGRPRPPVALPGPGTDEIGVEGWCITRIAVPNGDAVPLTLSYRAELRYEDESGGESALTRFGPRRLEYALFPAGFWQGAPDLAIELELGAFAPYSTVAAPGGGERRGTTHVWNISRADLRSLPSLVAIVDSRRLLAARELATWNARARRYPVSVSAIASSELRPQGGVRYSASRVADGDPSTAWCEGVPGPGAGESIELRFGRGSPPCQLQGISVVPGYAKNAGTFLGHGRVSRLRLAPCGGGPGTNHQLERTDDPALAAVLLPPPGVDVWSTGTFCIRLTILDVLPGTRHEDTCIAEMAPVFSCP